MIKVGDRVKATRSVGNRHVSDATGTVVEAVDQGTILVKFDEGIGDKLKVVAVGKHGMTSETLYACEDIDGTIFLIGSDGVEKIK